MTVLEVTAGIMELRRLRQTTRQLVNETTSGAVAGL